PKLLSQNKIFHGKSFNIFSIDQWIFERDVDRGFLGESLAEKIIFPYIPLNGKKYLDHQEIILKKRLILELLENLILNFPELSYNLHIKPEYFLYETMMIRARLFPPMIQSVLRFMHKEMKQKNTQLALRGYLEALKILEKKGTIKLTEEYTQISKEFLEKIKSKRIRFINLFKTARRTLFTSMLGTYSKSLEFISQTNKGFPHLQKNDEGNSRVLHELIDPMEYLFIPTADGLVSLSGRMDIKAFVKKFFSKEKAEIKIKKIGGVLNDVYLIEALVNHEEERIIVKSFRDLSSLKWFPINLWTFGTRSFAVLGRSRLEKECAINQLLRSNGFNVPRILYVNHHERLIFMEYLEGERINEIIKEIADTSEHKNEQQVERNLDVIRKIGQQLARIHSLDISLGDAKPENIIKKEEDKIFLLDLEQASRKGDKAWDIAEFLYYTGHYIQPFVGTKPMELITRSFIEGYIKAGGKAKFVKRAANPKYTKVFSIFTFPHQILTISKICKEASEKN
ncbi:MAG: lipopolysaccharide kinase InaA family protein, partial [Candidatus Bathyarchaeota archaeon]